MATEKSSSGSSVFGFSFSSVLTLIFVIAKLTGYITWSWLWVFAPMWISAGIALVIIIIALLIAIIVAALKDR